MTVSSTTRTAGPYQGTGLVSTYPFSFYVFQNTDVLVQQTDSLGNITTLAYGSGYTVTLNSNQSSSPGGTITLATPLPTGYTLVMTSQVPATQSVSIANNSGFYPAVVTQEFDYLTVLIQQVLTQLATSLQLPLAYSNGVSTQLPQPVSNKLIGWNSNATGLQNFDASTLASIVAFGTANADVFTGNGSQTVFTLTANPGAQANLDVSVGGVTQINGSDFVWSGGTTLTFTSAPPNGAKILARYQQTLLQGTADAGSVTYSDSGSYGSGTVGLRLKQMVSSIGAALVGYTQGGTGAASITVASKLQQTVNVLDFGADPTGVVDSTTSIQNAINSLPTGGILQFPPGTFKISATLNILKPVRLIGSGMGSQYIPVSAAVTKVQWAGGASPMMIFGANGTGSSFIGGGCEGMHLDGNNAATYGWTVKDIQYPAFRRVNFSQMVSGAILFTNTVGQITGFGECEDLYAQFLNAPTVGVNGFVIQGTTGGGADGTTLFMMRNCRVDHQNGAGVVVGDIGDAFIWERLFTYRGNSNTGFGVLFQSTANTTAVCGGHIFIKPICTAGFYFAGALLNNGTRVINANLFDMNTGSVLVSGPGAADVQAESDLGHAYGRGLLGNNHAWRHVDPMKYVRYDSTNNVLMTSAGNWITNLTAGGNYAGGVAPGGAISMTTTNTTNAYTLLQACPFADGSSIVGSSAALDVIVNLVTTTNVRVRFGFASSGNDPPTDGVYVQYDSSVSAFYQLVCISGGVATTVTTSFGPAGAKEEFFIYLAAGACVFELRRAGGIAMTYLGTITTNIPTAALAEIYMVKTLTTAVARLDVYCHKIGAPDEI